MLNLQTKINSKAQERIMLINDDILNAFPAISLEDMGKVRLMNRIDTKYVTTVDKIVELLHQASSEYFIQQIDGRKNMPYYTRYYDTADANMYYEHQRGKKTRQKIRVRQYEESDTPPFVEIKKKNNKGRTRKKRVSMTAGKTLDGYSEFIEDHSNYDTESLRPHIENHFYRITLVNKDMTERITIDSDLEFHNLVNDHREKLDGIGIIEWKRDGSNDKSRLDSMLKDLRIKQSGFSKYCIGMALTDSDLRQNRLKKKLRMIKRLGGSE